MFEQALELAKKDRASLMLFHCLSGKSEAGGNYSDIYGNKLVHFSQAMQESRQKDIQQAHNWLSTYCQKAEAQGVKTEWDLKQGDPEVSIRDLANNWDADLIVVGPRGRQGLTKIVLGSVSSYVVHHAPGAVLVVQGEKVTTGKTAKTETQGKS